jgi:hypothetical protein
MRVLKRVLNPIVFGSCRLAGGLLFLDWSVQAGGLECAWSDWRLPHGRRASQARSTKNLFPAGFAGKNILSVSPRLLKIF